MTIQEVLPMLATGKSLSEVFRIAEKQKTEVVKTNVISLAAYRAKKAMNKEAL